MINTQVKANNGKELSVVENSLRGSVDRQFSLMVTAIRLAQDVEREAYAFRIGNQEETSLTDIANAAWDGATSFARAVRARQAADTFEARYVELGEIIHGILDADLHERGDLAQCAEATRTAWREHEDITCPQLITAFDFAVKQAWLPVAKEGDIDIQFHT